MLGLLLLSTALPAARLEATLPTPSAPGAAFARFKAAYSKSYAPHEEPHRLARFEASLREIDAINGADRPWRAGLNQFADLSWEEFQSSVLMAAQNCSATGRAVGGGHAKRLSAPPAIDWRDYKALNAVKNQAACGSCWTFSTTGCLEAHVFLKSGHMPNISEQQLVDCAGAFNNNGCNGGLPSQAYEYIRYAGGIDSEDAYPYVAKTGAQCGFKGAGVVAKVRQVVNITERDEAELEDAVGTVGPVSIAFEVAEDFRFYKSGVYDGACHDDSQHVNHAVVAVGYGATDDGAPYWIVRNSWSAAWGEEGYFRIARGVNKCGIADCASYPIVA